uniref:Odorant receptor n=1 Tax=Athetis dissimilis TaxID=1737331 RepID=A0A0S1TKZ3_ATHDI|nr:odorant receptor 29 [Athetis dissimilis]
MNSILQSLEDPKRPLLGPNYWIITKMGLLLPQNKLNRIIFIIIHEIVALFVITQYMELYVIRSDLDLVLTNMKISMLSVVCVVKVNTFIFWQKHWQEVFDYITEADKFERQSKDPMKVKIVEAYTKYCRRLSYFYWALVTVTFFTTTGTPLMRYLSSSTFRENMRNGTEDFPHIFSSWMPFDKYHLPGNWITVVWHVVLCAYGAGIMAAYDSLVVVIMVFFGGKVDLLRERCRQMFGEEGDTISDEKCEEVVRQLHNIHVTMLKYSRLFNSLLSPVMFFYMVMCSLVLCASAYQLTSAQNAAQKLLMAEYLVFAIAQLFVYCWHSNDVLIKNENMTLGPFESNWYNMESNQPRKDVLTLSGQLRIENVFTAGPFSNLTLPTFINILKGAYSYYTLLRK